MIDLREIVVMQKNYCFTAAKINLIKFFSFNFLYIT